MSRRHKICQPCRRLRQICSFHQRKQYLAEIGQFKGLSSVYIRGVYSPPELMTLASDRKVSASDSWPLFALRTMELPPTTSLESTVTVWARTHRSRDRDILTSRLPGGSALSRTPRTPCGWLATYSRLIREMLAPAGVFRPLKRTCN